MSFTMKRWTLVLNAIVALATIILMIPAIVPDFGCNLYVIMGLISVLWFYFPIVWGIENLKPLHFIVGLFLAIALFGLHRWGLAYFYFLLFVEVAMACLPLLIQSIRFGAK